MRLKFFIAIFFLAVVFSVSADEKFSALKVGKQTYTNVTVTSVSPTDIFFTHSGGMSNAKLKDLEPALQKHFNYDAAKADAIEKKRAEANAQFHKEIVSQPAPQSADETRPPPARTSEGDWGGDVNAAVALAHAQNKFVLMDFTCSDNSPYSKRFDDDILSTVQFLNYARQKLVLVRLDFPQHTPLSDEVKNYNAGVGQQFGIKALPTLVLLDSNGREIGRQIGYMEGGPKAFIALLDSYAAKK